MTAAPDTLVRDLLDEYGRHTRVALCDYLGPRHPRRQLYAPLADYPRRGGRMLRPSLCIATARALGATIEETLPTAVGIELLHNAFLVHDDVEDESDERRGRPTLNAMHGAAIAVNVGDGLALLGLRALIDNRRALGHRLAWRILEEAERMSRESIEGQALELGWRRDNATSLQDRDYLEMVLKKTCWYTTIFPIRAGVLIATRGEPDLDAFLRFGFLLGAAFQIRDDLLNLEGDPVRYGKEVAGDLWEGKRTLMLIHLLREATAREELRLRDFLSMPRTARRPADVAWVRSRMEHYGSLEYARLVAHALAGAAAHEAATAWRGVPDGRDRRFIQALPAWVLTRT